MVNAMSFFVTVFNLLGQYLQPLDQLSFVHTPVTIARVTIGLGWPRPVQTAFATVRFDQPPLSIQLKRFYQVGLILAFFAFISSSAGWVQAAQVEPTSGLTLEVIGPASVTMGETFEVQVVANVPPPGIFGYQFWLNWDNALVTPVEATPILSSDFPLVVQAEVTEGQLKMVASRQSDVPDIAGSLTLLTWRFQANAAGTVNLDLTTVTLGQSDGLPLPVERVTGLPVTVVEVIQPQGSLIVNVQVEGRPPGSQADYSLSINELGLATTTTAAGNFVLPDLPFGTYSLTISSPGFLGATCTNVVHSAETTVLAGITLLAGDFDSDGQISMTDATAIGLSFSHTGPGQVTDLNADGQVNVLDLILMAANFGRSSADNPWICQP